MYSFTNATFRTLAPIRTDCHRIGGAQAIRVASTTLANLCPAEPVFGTNELDSHADTCVLGRNFIVAQYSGRECDVVPYSSDYAAVTGVPIVTGATAWTDQHTGETWIIFIHEALWMAESMPHSLFNPNQLRAHGVDVKDNPSRGPLHMSVTPEELYIPLTMLGTNNILFESRTPTQEELDHCRHVHLTSSSEWTPDTAHERFPHVSISAMRSRIADLATEDASNGIYNPVAFSLKLLQSPGISNSRSVQNYRSPPPP